MARPQKKGMDYFSFDVGFFDDRKIKELRGKYGSDGITVYIYLLCLIYKENGYYAQIDDGFDYVASADLNMGSEKIGQIINFLCERSLFDNTLFTSDKVLTSHGIQLRFQEAVKSRASKNEIEVGKFWVLDKNETQSYIKHTDFQSYSEKNGSYSEKNDSFSEEKPHKVKESKVKKSKGNSNTPAQVYEQIVKSYNDICLDLPKVRDITDKRKALIDARLKKYTPEQFTEVFQNAHKSDFLSGRLPRKAYDPHKDWRCTFDWLMDKNRFVQVLEGIYHNGNGNCSGYGSEKNFNVYRDNVDHAELEQLMREKYDGGAE